MFQDQFQVPKEGLAFPDVFSWVGDWSDRLLNLVFIWCSPVTLLADGIVVVTKEAIELGFHSRLPMTEVETTRCTRPRKIRVGGSFRLAHIHMFVSKFQPVESFKWNMNKKTRFCFSLFIPA